MEQDEKQQRDALFGHNAQCASTTNGLNGLSDRGYSSVQVGRFDQLRNDAVYRRAWDYEGRDGVAEEFRPAPGETQQEPRHHLSWAQVRDNINISERNQGLRSAHDSVEIGRNTLESLDDQKERLERSEMVVDSTRYAIERSARVLRGMTFWGKISNAFTEEPKIPDSQRSSTANGRASPRVPRGTRNATKPDDAPIEGFICPECRRRYLSAQGLVLHFNSEHDGVNASNGDREGPGERHHEVHPDVAQASFGTDARVDDSANTTDSVRLYGQRDHSGDATNSSRQELFGGRDTTGITGTIHAGGGGVLHEQKAFMAAQDKYLDDVGKVVKELGILGRNIGTSLDEQGNTLDRLADKTEESHERTKFITRKAARQSQKSKPKRATFVKSVALQEVSTGLFMTVTGEDVLLRSPELRNVCRFEAWQRQEGILGFKSGVTGKWFGQTFLGYLRLSGNSFTKNYEWQANLSREDTTMICCSANWGAGGYLSKRTVTTKNEHDGDGPTSARCGDAVPTSAGATSSVVAQAELFLIEATQANRSRAAVFRVVDCDGYIPSPYVGGRLMRPPDASNQERCEGPGGEVWQR